MADGRTARPGHVTRERALCTSPAPSTAIFSSPLPPRSRPLAPLLYLPRTRRAAPRSSGPLKGTGNGVRDDGRARTIENKERCGEGAARGAPAAAAPALPRAPGVRSGGREPGRRRGCGVTSRKTLRAGRFGGVEGRRAFGGFPRSVGPRKGGGSPEASARGPRPRPELRPERRAAARAAHVPCPLWSPAAR